jgi:hypothetical protein
LHLPEVSLREIRLFVDGSSRKPVFSMTQREYKLKDMQTPETGADLYPFLSAMNWRGFISVSFSYELDANIDSRLCITHGSACATHGGRTSKCWKQANQGFCQEDTPDRTMGSGA